MEAVVVVCKNGPLMVTGECIVKDAKGAEFQTDGEIYLCRCGASADKPFCDGSHEKAEFKSVVRAPR